MSREHENRNGVIREWLNERGKHSSSNYGKFVSRAGKRREHSANSPRRDGRVGRQSADGEFLGQQLERKPMTTHGLLADRFPQCGARQEPRGIEHRKWRRVWSHKQGDLCAAQHHSITAVVLKYSNDFGKVRQRPRQELSIHQLVEDALV